MFAATPAHTFRCTRMSQPSLFRHYQIVQDAEGNNIELVRSAEQVAVLSFDSERLEFVHCHVLLEPLANRPLFEEACRKLQREGHPALARLVDFGEDDGNPFYITANVDGETLRNYLQRQSELPLWLAVMIACRALESAIALGERGDFLTDEPLDSFRIVQASASAVAVMAADFRVLESSSKNKNRVLKSNFERQAKFLRTFLSEHGGGGGPTLPDTMLPAMDFAELLGGALASSGPALAAVMVELRNSLHKFAPEHLAGEVPTAQKPRALIAPLLATYQEVARGVVNLVRIQSQRLDMANPYSMRGTLTKTGRAVLVEQVPPDRLCGRTVENADKQVQKSGKKREANAIVPLPLVNEIDGLTCLAEEVVDGISIAELLASRGNVEITEAYLILAGLDAALSQIERAELGTRKLRLEDIFLLTGFSKDDSRTTKLLASKINQWPSFSIMLRAHPTLASMSGRGIDPAILAPPTPDDCKLGQWHGAWMAGVGKFLLSTSSESTKAVPSEREAVDRLLEDELNRVRDGTSYATRSDFLARFARVIQHYDLVQPTPVAATDPAPKAKSKVSAAADTQPKVSAPAPPQPKKKEARPESNPLAATLLPTLTQGIEAAGAEKPTIGFAELLFQGGASETAHVSPLGGNWGKGASEAFSTGEVGGWGVDEPDNSPFWLKATVFIAGSMMAGIILAHFSGHALWQHRKLPPTATPAAVAPARR